MRMELALRFALVGLLFTGVLSGAHGTPFNTTLSFDADPCAQSDVKTGGSSNSTACVGFVNGNTTSQLSDWNSIDWADAITNHPASVNPDYNASEPLGLFGETDWLGNWRCEDCTTGQGDVGLIYNESLGSITLNLTALGAFSQFSVILKQANFWAAYLFENTATSPLTYTWEGPQGSPGGTDLSHIDFLYRTGVVPPGPDPGPTPMAEPATLFTFGVGAAVMCFAAWRRRV